MHFLPSCFVLPAAFILDLLLGDPPSLPHPVRWMGKAIELFEPLFRKIPGSRKFAGTLFCAFLFATTGILALGLLYFAQWVHPWLKISLEVILSYLCIAVRSLEDAAMEIHGYLLQNKVAEARKKVAMIVGRDVTRYDEEGISRAVVETVAENLVDGVISPLFFAVIGGAPLALMYKMVNTLDSMVGYKNERYMDFGKASARLDDIFNFIPARLSIPIIAMAIHILSGRGLRCLKTAVLEGANHSSPNAGYPEAAFAGALAVRLNGPNYYNGRLVEKPYIGVRFGKTSITDIKKACDIMMLSSFFWLIIVWGTSTLLNFTG
jgi:adenosylcobinamide-phosphate synthase